MTRAQTYCTVNDLIADSPQLTGDKGNLLDYIRRASEAIERSYGAFIPVTETRKYDGKVLGKDTLIVDPLLAITSITDDGTTLTGTDYTLQPLNRWWANGPYTRIQLKSGSWSDEIEIIGRWGKYEESVPVGLTVTQLMGDTTLVVANGAKISPGMVALIESEQELVTAGNGGKNSPNPTLATSLLNGAVTIAADEIVVDNGAEFYEGEVLRLDTEDVYILKIVGDTLIVSRGWNGTKKMAHLSNLAVYVYRTFTVERGVNGTTAADHSSKALYRYKAPEIVAHFARQIAILMIGKAGTGYTGRAGTDENGSVFYINEFPRQAQEIRQMYGLWE